MTSWSVWWITISLTESKIHITILSTKIHCHYAKIADSFKLSPFKTDRTSTVQLHIRHKPTVNTFLNCSAYFWGPGCDIMYFFSHFSWKVCVFDARFFGHLSCTLSKGSRSVKFELWHQNTLSLFIVNASFAYR